MLDLRVAAEHMTAEGDVEEDLGIPATGLHTEWVGMVVFRMECGKIAEI